MSELNGSTPIPTAALKMRDFDLSVLSVGSPGWRDLTATPDPVTGEYPSFSKKPCIISNGEPRLLTWGKYQKTRMTPAEIERNFKGIEYIGIACGKVSGNLEVIDFDLPGVYEQWVEMLFAIGGDYDLIEKLTMQDTQTQGCRHAIYRCETIQGNTKLARYYDPLEKDINGNPLIKASIETRGEGGYIVAHPSPGYTMHQGDFDDIKTISTYERNLLLKAARMLNVVIEAPTVTVAKPVKPHDGTRPGDDYNARATWSELLEPIGGTLTLSRGGREYWLRPGKSGRDWSATTGNGRNGQDMLYMFTSNWHPFEPEQCYSKFHVYTMIHHGGNHSEASKALLQQGYGERKEKAAPTVIDPRTVIEDPDDDAPIKKWNRLLWSDILKKPPKEMIVDGLIGKQDSGMIFGLPKSGKTFVVFDLLMSCISGTTFAGKFKVARPLKVAYFTNEGLGSIKERLEAAKTYQDVPFDVIEENLFYFEDVPQLYDEKANMFIQSFVDEYFDQGIDLIIIDTLNKASLGSDENSNTEAAQICNTLMLVRRVMGCATILLHHTGKAGDKVRGASAYDGDLDWQLKAEKLNEASSDRKLSVTLAKDITVFDPIQFSLQKMNDTAVVAWAGMALQESESKTLIQKIVDVMYRFVGKEWWTLSQIRDLIPEATPDSVRRTCSRESDNPYGKIKVKVDEDGRKLAEYSIR